MRIQPSSTTVSFLCLSLTLAGTGFSQAQVQPDPRALVAAHNQWRAKVGAPDLKWSEALAQSAQAWAETLQGKGCELGASRGAYGENLFWAGPLVWSDGKTEAAQVSAEQVVAYWGKEAAHYDPVRNECSGGECRGYTQVVWSDTTEVGCGTALCQDSQARVWVCQYLPQGNIIGRRPFPLP